MHAGEGFGGVECVGAGADAVRRERGLRSGGDWFLRERVRERFEGGIVVEREVHAFVGLDEDEDADGGITISANARIRSEPR